MSLADLFNKDTILTRIPRAGGQTGGRLDIPGGSGRNQKDISRPHFGNEYAQRIVQQEEQEYLSLIHI